MLSLTYEIFYIRYAEHFNKIFPTGGIKIRSTVFAWEQFILESLKIQKSLTLTIYSPFQILQYILQLIQITLQH